MFGDKQKQAEAQVNKDTRDRVKGIKERHGTRA
jgi:hypothetical protein